jgi:hypothetical protein
VAELVRTNDPGLISATAIQIRILVPDEQEAEARELLLDAELGNWLRP